MREKTELNGKPACAQRCYRIGPQDLPLCCPPRDQRIWDAHPRVYLPIEEEGEVHCPYCSARYILEKGSN